MHPRFVLCLILCPSAMFSIRAAAADEPQPPNILFCFADDWGRYASIYRDAERPGFNDVIETPVLDRIGREGVVFQNAFVNAPSCTPSRAAVTTGMYFHQCGSNAFLRCNWQGAPNPYDELPGWPALLHEEGYAVGHTGKTTGKRGPGQGVFNQAGLRMSQFSQTVSDADDAEAAKQQIYSEVRENFQTFLAERAQGQPFAYWLGPTNCHRRWVKGSGRELWGIDLDDLEGRLPPFLPDVPEVREDIADYLGEVLAWDAMVGVLVEELERMGELDDTLIVLSGDHGFPGMPRGKCNLYDFGVHVPLLVRWGARVPAGRYVDDFVNLMDLAPTFLEAAGMDVPGHIQARSLLPLLDSENEGRIDPGRDHVVVGRERHVWDAQDEWLPYPSRAIRTDDFLYIRNFAPDRWPMGVERAAALSEGPAADALESNTMVGFNDWDASPTKAWLVMNQREPDVQPFFDIAVARRPGEELYDLRVDPDQMENVAGDANYQDQRRRLERRLMGVLTETGDPRIVGDGETFDLAPYVEDEEHRNYGVRNRRRR